MKQADIRMHIAELNGKDGLKRKQARQELIAMGSEAVPALMDVLENGSVHARWESAKALQAVASPEAAPALVAALEDQVFSVRWLAAKGLIKIGRPALLPLLEALIEHKDEIWLYQGAHHVLHAADQGPLHAQIGPVLEALEGLAPADAVAPAALDAYKALVAEAAKS